MNMLTADSVLSRIVVVSTLLASCSAKADESFRVVVRDVRPDYLAASRDGRIAVSRGYEGRHVFHVVDLEKPEVVLTIDLPEKITSAAIAPMNDWFAVSGESTIYRVDLATGQHEVLLPNTSGAVAFDRTGERLAVLGQFDYDEKPFRRGLLSSSNLGVYDVVNNKWLAKTRTPILIDSIAYFDGDVAVGYGRGGRVHNRRASSFRCDVKLDPTNGKSTLTRGLEKYGRGEIEGDEYTPPEPLTALQQIKERSKKRLADNIERLNASEATNQTSGLFIPMPDTKRISFLTERRSKSAIQAGLVNIKRDGTIEIQPVDIPGNRIDFVHLISGKLLSGDSYQRVGTVTDLRDKEVSFTIPKRQDDSSPKDRSWDKFLSVGCLVYRPGKLSFFVPGKEKPLWEIESEKPLGRANPIFSSPDGLLIAIGGDDKEVLFDIRAADDGRRVCQIKRVGKHDGYSLSACFNTRCDQFGIIANKQVVIYEIPSGKHLHTEPSPREIYYWHLSNAAQRWIIGGSPGTQTYGMMSGKGATIALADINRSTAIRVKDRDCLLVETRHGRGGIADLETGELLTKWYVGQYQGSGNLPAMPARAFTAFDGKLLVRRKAHAAEIELIDLKTLVSIATIHPVPTNDKLGWIVATPDGYWDASPGAEKYVAVFRGLTRSSDEQSKSRRNSKLVQSRIAAIASQ